MPGFYDGGDNALWVFLLVTVAIGGSAAFLTGRAMAQTWRPFWHIPFYMLGIAAAVRFFHFALFGEPLISLNNFLIAYAVTMAAAALGHRRVRARQMAGQYSWLYRPSGLFGWRRVR